ncbi:MFS transporter [Antarctobacter heliothermus]|uniref:Major Facilitator Superfamily protein n=1 Tax=Antarctobacter heliothermus TaxID=74033 RepID=A0A239KNT1_9RHOB|nr:MFS transporter [Antarctobacter heliothermus]SNT19831.1 Major Facilitator Superfamily protein [Antarctobacter heliothermus]
MASPWTALAILFTARLSMAFQYQVVAALGPLLMDRHGADLADLGVLISLYLLPGMIFALPGGGIARRFGDRRVVVGGLIVMVIGGVIMWLGQGWTLQCQSARNPDPLSAPKNDPLILRRGSWPDAV